MTPQAGFFIPAEYAARTAAKVTAFRFHDLRHSWATRLVQNGVDLYTVQKLGRWRTLSMVLRYAHHSTETLRPRIEVLDRLRTQTSTKQAQPVKKAGAVPTQVMERIGAPGRN